MQTIISKNLEDTKFNDKIPDKHGCLFLPKEMWPEGFKYLRKKPRNMWIRGKNLWSDIKDIDPDITDINRIVDTDEQSSILKLFDQKPKQSIDQKRKFICVIGSRRGSRYGYDVCKLLMAGLFGKPVVIVSGLAYGIDEQAHHYALAANLPCVALPGSGIDDEAIYPRENLKLARDILANGGALLSEMPCHSPPTKWSFPNRNRLMAAMSDLIVVVEGGERSGTFITALQALDLGKTIGAVPGPIDSLVSRAPHALIRDGAFPITCAKDILELVGLE